MSSIVDATVAAATSVVDATANAATSAVNATSSVVAGAVDATAAAAGSVANAVVDAAAAPVQLVTTAPSTTNGSQALTPLPMGWTSEFSEAFNQWFFIDAAGNAQWDDPRVRIHCKS